MENIISFINDLMWVDHDILKDSMLFQICVHSGGGVVDFNYRIHWMMKGLMSDMEYLA